MLITDHTLREAAATLNVWLCRGSPGIRLVCSSSCICWNFSLPPPKRLGIMICFKKAKLNPVESPPPASPSVTNTTLRSPGNKIQLSQSMVCVTSNSKTSPTSRQLLFIQPFCNQPTGGKKKKKSTCNPLHFRFSSIWQPSRKQDTTSQECKGFTNQFAK